MSNINSQLNKIGNNIKRIREAKNIKQEFLATRTGICKSYLSRIENGNRDLSVSKLIKIAETLEVPISSLFE